MKQILNKARLLALVVFLAACQKDNLINDINNNTIKQSKITVKEGRLYFSSIETLRAKYEKIKEKKDVDIYKEMSKYYPKDFINLRPIVTNDNENKISNQLIKREIKVEKILKQNNQISNTFANSIQSATPQAIVPNSGNIIDNIDDLEDIIGDMAFASFLNGDAEVQVADKIYKYTDVGLFISKANSYNNMVTYLNQNSISKNLLVPTCAIQKQAYLMDVMPNGGLTAINSNLSYYRAPKPLGIISVQGCNSGGGGSSGGSGSGSGSGSGGSSTQTLESYIATLQPCNSKSGLFGSLFGKNIVCIDQYESKKRVKTKAFNYNYFLVYHLGVKVKHQKKGWTGLWRQQNTEEIGMLVGVQYKYKFAKLIGPGLSTIDQSYRVLAIGKNIPAFQRGYYEFSNTIPYHNFIFESGVFYPDTHFNDDLVIDYFGNGNVIDKSVALGNDKNTRKIIDNYFKSFVYPDSKNTIINTIYNNYTMPDNITFLSKHPAYGMVWVQKIYKNFSTNSSKVEKTFDSGLTVKAGTKNFKFVISPQGPPSGEVKLPVKDSFGGKVIGVTKSNGQWHGSLMEF